MNYECSPCRERLGKSVPAVRKVGEDWFCERCFRGGDPREPASPLRHRSFGGAPDSASGYKALLNRRHRKLREGAPMRVLHQAETGRTVAELGARYSAWDGWG